MTHATMLTTCAAITITGALLAVAIPTPSNPIVIQPFEQSWRESMVPLGFKQAQLKTTPPEPTPVRVIPIIPTTNSQAPAVPVTPEVTEEPEPAVRVAKRHGSRTERHTARDICRGKGKRYINRYKWRCRR